MSRAKQPCVMTELRCYDLTNILVHIWLGQHAALSLSVSLSLSLSLAQYSSKGGAVETGCSDLYDVM